MTPHATHRLGMDVLDALRSLEIHPTRADARTPPPWLYLDPVVHARVLERVFAPAWHLLNDEGPALEPGRARGVDVLSGSLDECAILVRDEHELRALSGVCPHRGARVLDGETAAATLRCPYHGRRFCPDGTLRDAPGFEDAELDPIEEGLTALESFARGPFVWARFPGSELDDDSEPVCEELPTRASFASVLDELDLPWDDLSFDSDASRDYDIAANWALYVDNYLEGMHVPYVHAQLDAGLRDGSYRIELREGAVVQRAAAADGEVAFPAEGGHADAARWGWIFPNLMLNAYPWGLSINVVEPRGVDRCRVRFRSWVHDPALRDRGAGGDLHRVELEDEEVVESVARGLRSRTARRGRYADAEKGVHHFHRLLVAALRPRA